MTRNRSNLISSAVTVDCIRATNRARKVGRQQNTTNTADEHCKVMLKSRLVGKYAMAVTGKQELLHVVAS